MPEFENVEVTTTVDIDFEVFCGTCGAGLCGESDTRNSRNRGYLQVTVNTCPTCMEEKEERIRELEARVEELEPLVDE